VELASGGLAGRMCDRANATRPSLTPASSTIDGITTALPPRHHLPDAPAVPQRRASAVAKRQAT
jgi:hypothetical protein